MKNLLLNFKSVTIVEGYVPVFSSNRCSNISVVPGVYAFPVEYLVKKVSDQFPGIFFLEVYNRARLVVKM